MPTSEQHFQHAWDNGSKIKPTTPRQHEILVHLTEEAGEVIQEICKIERYGLDSSHPDDPKISNKTRLEREVADFLGTCALLGECGEDVFSMNNVMALVPVVKEKKRKRFLSPPDAA